MNMSKERYGCALLLTGHEDAFSIERAALRQAGILRVRMLNSGRQGLAVLSRQLGGESLEADERFDRPVDFVVCTESLSDMTGQAFLRELSTICRDLSWDLPPVLAVTGEPDSQAALLTLGAVAVLVRPYAVTELGECLKLLAASSRGALPKRKLADNFTVKPAETTAVSAVAISDEIALIKSASALPAAGPDRAGLDVPIPEAGRPLLDTPLKPLAAPAAAEELPIIVRCGSAVHFDSHAAEALNPLLYTRRGLALLRENRLEEAEHLLRLALDQDSLDLEACLGLTRLCRQLADEAGEERWNTRAAVICLRSGQPERAELFLSRLPRDTAADPFMAEARCLLREEDYQGAAEAFMDLRDSRPEIPLHELAARASLFTDCPRETLRELCAAYKRNGQDLTALQLYNRLLARSDEEPEPFDDFDDSGPFPVLREVLAVMKFAASAWRNAAV